METTPTDFTVQPWMTEHYKRWKLSACFSTNEEGKKCFSMIGQSNWKTLHPSSEELHALACVFATHRDLSIIVLRCCRLVDMTILSKTLPLCTQLQELDFSYNDINAQGVAPLADVLHNFLSLECLSFNDNDLGSAGVAILAQGLVQNSSLTLIDLSENEIGNEGVYTLRDTLPRYTPNLKWIALAANGIDSNGEWVVEQMAENLHHLTRIVLCRNNLELVDMCSTKYHTFCAEGRSPRRVEVDRDTWREQGGSM